MPSALILGSGSRKKVELSGVNGHFGSVTAIAAQELCRKPNNDVKNDAHYVGAQMFIYVQLTHIHELDATGKIVLNPMIQNLDWVPPKHGYMSWTQLARRIHGLDATGKVALNPIIQSSDRVLPKEDTWAGRHWQGGAQSNNPEFGLGTTT
ncbi:hypothetical protein B0H14DRAFT_2608149 [Mycena olivaceomarginata]|nr:hypothetical protein B0H14DRAFT_2608149 [Mycena olivaceomarginata]